MEQIKSQRIHFLDELRGLSILFVVVYHLLYDLVVIFGVNLPGFFSPFVQGLVPAFVFVLVYISGASCSFSRNNLIRGARCFLVAIGLTLVTYFFMRDQLIVFGILHMLGLSMIIYALLTPLLKKIHPLLLIIVGTLLYILTFNIANGYLGFGSFRITLPTSLYEIGWLFPLGFPSSRFFSADYYSLIPWLFCFIAGSGFGRVISQPDMPEFVYKKHTPPLAFIGRHTLIVYILHQPVVYGILYIIFS